MKFILLILFMTSCCPTFGYKTEETVLTEKNGDKKTVKSYTWGWR